jgi:hypothetical protein
MLCNLYLFLTLFAFRKDSTLANLFLRSMFYTALQVASSHPTLEQSKRISNSVHVGIYKKTIMRAKKKWIIEVKKKCIIDLFALWLKSSMPTNAKNFWCILQSSADVVYTWPYRYITFTASETPLQSIDNWKKVIFSLHESCLRIIKHSISLVDGTPLSALFVSQFRSSE